MRRAYVAMAQWQSDPILNGDYRTESEHVHRVIDLDRLLKIERGTVES